MIKNKQKDHFKTKLEGVTKTIWDIEFKRFKTLEIKEEIREQYDQGKARLSGLLPKIEKAKKDGKMSKDEIGRLEDEKVILERDTDRYKLQIDQLEVEVNGSKPTDEYKEGVQGISQQLDALHELKDMIKAYIKSL